MTCLGCNDRGRQSVSKWVGMQRAYLCYSHGAGDWTDAVADGGQEANLQTVDRLVEILDLLLLGRFVIPLLGD